MHEIYLQSLSEPKIGTKIVINLLILKLFSLKVKSLIKILFSTDYKHPFRLYWQKLYVEKSCMCCDIFLFYLV